MTRRFVGFLYCIAGLTIAIPASTLAIIGLLPAPRPTFSPQLAPGVEGLPEFRDRVTIVAWILLTSVAGLTAWYAAKLKQTESQSRSTTLQRIMVALSTTTILASLLWRFDPAVTYNVKQLTLIELGTTAIICASVFALSRLPLKRIAVLKGWWNSLQFVTAGVLFVLMFPTFFQTPSTLRDPGHFMFVSDELLAPSVGKWPMSDYLSQYSNFLGFPLLPLVQLSADHAITVVVGYIVLLQLLCIATPAFMAVSAGQRQLVVTAVALCAVICAAMVYTYFQIFPLRTFMPSLLLVLTVVAVRKSQPRLFLCAVVGCCAALTVLNNPDFGTFALLAAVVSLLASELSLLPRLKLLGSFSVGLVTGVVAVVLAYRGFGHELHIEYLFTFQRVFGEAGYFNAPMAAGGLPVAIATIFGVSILLAIYAYSRSRELDDSRYRASATQLMYSSIWGLLSSVYFAGRSFSSTALGGYSYPLALTFAGVIIYVSLDRQHLMQQLRSVGDIRQIVPILGIAALSLLVMSTLRMATPKTTMDLMARSGTDFVVERFWIDQLFTDDYETLSELGLLKDGEITTGILLPSSNALQMKTNLHSLLVSNHPGNARTSIAISELQCRHLAESGIRFLIEENVDSIEGEIGYRSILQMPECQTLFGPNLRTIYLSPTLRVLENTLSKEE